MSATATRQSWCQQCQDETHGHPEIGHGLLHVLPVTDEAPWRIEVVRHEAVAATTNDLDEAKVSLDLTDSHHSGRGYADLTLDQAVHLREALSAAVEALETIASVEGTR